MNYKIEKFVSSWKNKEGNINSTKELLDWIRRLNEETFVNIVNSSIDENSFWFYDEKAGIIKNRQGSFFTIEGMKEYRDGNLVKEQPIIIQAEIGFLGIIAKEIDGEINLLMQAKIEPGNINNVQISPTIQATKSNFTGAHGGKSPNYLNYFVNAKDYTIIYDQVQSEQGARFFKKRNRNMLILVEDEVEVLDNFAWMTLGQIKELMKIDNLVNMDTRTVISGIPFSLKLEKIDATYFEDKTLYRSIFEASPIDTLPDIFNIINDNKMFADVNKVQVPLYELDTWKVTNAGVYPTFNSDFLVEYFDIEIEGREVRKWQQPLFKADGIATFGLLTKNIKGIKHFLVKMELEIGTFDTVELGPTIQWESTHNHESDNLVDQLFIDYVSNEKGITHNVILSEEGGRFYHEQNKNYIVELEEHELENLPNGYIWANFAVLNFMIQSNNLMNIQLRNLLSLLTI